MVRALQALWGLAATSTAAAGYFLIAGRTDLPAAWAGFAVLAVLSVVSMAGIDAELLRERRKPGPGGRDRATANVGRVLSGAVIVYAGADVGRLHWSDGVPRPLAMAGAVATALGLGFAIWAMLENRFFSSVVRLQKERGHHVVTTGPYRWVRHPGYAGMLVGLPGIGLALGSWGATAALVALGVLLVRRIPIEERLLAAGLEGYEAYASRVRWRLVPGVW